MKGSHRRKKRLGRLAVRLDGVGRLWGGVFGYVYIAMRLQAIKNGIYYWIEEIKEYLLNRRMMYRT